MLKFVDHENDVVEVKCVTHVDSDGDLRISYGGITVAHINRNDGSIKLWEHGPDNISLLMKMGIAFHHGSIVCRKA